MHPDTFRAVKRNRWSGKFLYLQLGMYDLRRNQVARIAFIADQKGVVQMTEVKAKVGGVAVLPCDNNIHSDNPLKHYNVYWQKVIGKNKTDQVAISYWKGREDAKHPNYQYRTTMDLQNFTLWISSVKVSDEGRYKCIILEEGTNSIYLSVDIYLSVVADFSRPVINVDIHANTCGSALLILRCCSHGGYPEPTISGLLNNNEVEWKPISVLDNQKNLFNITGYLELNNVTEDIFFRCIVSYSGFHVSTSYNCTIPKECSAVIPLSSWIVIAAGVSLAFFVVVAALANIQCCKRHTSLCYARSHQPVARSEVNSTALTPLQPSSGTS
ncbi:T-lymphocyte activation antigen CD80 [Sphaerodactylus townsendi]|uniref:T-lymphocyte activation antigen CD80 n=1 Tax=Sphaerodactylus townsendi TaxID=933632 RepID=UPI002027334E|nr:T-lymphocyte activation antigen CD80 [Sphaerodactylus townsendi]